MDFNEAGNQLTQRTRITATSEPAGNLSLLFCKEESAIDSCNENILYGIITNTHTILDQNKAHSRQDPASEQKASSRDQS